MPSEAGCSLAQVPLGALPGRHGVRRTLSASGRRSAPDLGFLTGLRGGLSVRDAHFDLPQHSLERQYSGGCDERARYGCWQRGRNSDKTGKPQQTEQRSGHRAASLAKETAEKPYACARQKSSQILPGQSVVLPSCGKQRFPRGHGA